MRRVCSILSIFSIVFLICGAVAFSQVSPDSLIGNPPGANILPVRFGFVNLDNGNLHLDIPMFSRAQRGQGPIVMSVTYDSTFWSSAVLSGGYYAVAYPVNSGINFNKPMGNYLDVQPIASVPITCPTSYPIGSITHIERWAAIDGSGTEHVFLLDTYAGGCSNAAQQQYPASEYGPTSGTAYSVANEGFLLTVVNGDQASVLYPDGSGAGETPNGNLANSTSPTTGLTSDTYGETINVYGQNVTYNMTGTCPLPVKPQTLYRSDQPYVAQAPESCSMQVPAWDGNANQAVTATYTFNYKYIPVCTNFYTPAQDASVDADFCGGMWVLGSLVEADGSTYSFGYDQGTTAGHFGQLTSITLPTGGTVSYSYAPTTSSWVRAINTITDNGGTTRFSFTPNIAGQPYYPVSVQYPPHIVNPVNGQTATDSTQYTVSSSGQSSTRTRQDYSGSTLIKTTVQDITVPLTPSYVKETWNQSSVTHEIDYKYGLGNTITEKDELSNGVLYRTVKTQFLADTSSIKYVSQYNMINYPTQTQALDASNNIVGQTNYNYDEYGAGYCSSSYPAGLSGIAMLSSVAGANAHDDTRGTSYSARGNVTSVSRLVSPGVSVVSHSCYDTLGNVTQTVDAKGYATRYDYTDNFHENACSPSGTLVHALPSLITDALGHQTKTTNYSCTRNAQATQDPNDLANNRGGTTYTYDIGSRALCVNYPDGGSTCNSYPTANTIDTSQLLLVGQTPHTIVTTFDSFGRVANTTDSVTGAKVDTVYDAQNNLYSVSNPYFTTSDASYGVTSYVYDVLGRKTLQQQPDASTESWTYSGNSVTFQDELGNQWKQTNDPLGRLTQVLEPSPTNPAPTLETDYSYNELNNLIGVNQIGVTGETPRKRTFTYDFLSRLVCSDNPESASVSCPATVTSSLPSGAMLYNYDANSNLTKVTDARPVSTTLGYDALNRLISRTYSDSTPPVSYNYDEQTVSWSSSTTLTNTIGRLSSASVGTTAYSRYGYLYDSMGRLLYKLSMYPNSAGTAVQPSVGSSSYTYDLAGNVTFIAEAAGVYFYPTRDNAGRLISASANKSTTSILNGVYSQKLFANAVYTASGALSARLLGNGLTETRTYDKRERLTGTTQSQNGSPIGYSFSTSYDLDNNTAQVTDSVNGSWTYSYDHLNRLTGASSLPTLNLGWTYDSFGNRKTQVAYAGSAPQPSFSYSLGNNRADASGGFTFDLAGDITTDNFGQTYSYDAERRISTVTSSGGTTTNKYDSEGQLVYESGPHGIQVFQRNAEGQATFITNPTPNGPPYSIEGVYLDGEHIGSWQHDEFHWIGKDWLGTKRYESAGQGDIASTAVPQLPVSYTSLPFGDVLSSIGTDPTHFTGKERDVESGNDYFGARYYSSGTGRFMSPDPSGLVYADPTNPQSLNLYSYARNNPLKLVDPSGLTPCDYGSSDQGGEDYEDADNDKECTDNGGTPIDYSETVNVNANGNGDNFSLSTVEAGSSTLIQTGGLDAPSNPCGMSTAQRAYMFGSGLLNLTSAGVKIFAAGSVEVGSGGLGTALALYGAYSAGGNITTGLIQTVGAFMPSAGLWKQAASVSSSAGSISGLAILAATNGNLTAAASASRWEGFAQFGLKGGMGNPPDPTTFRGAVSTASAANSGYSQATSGGKSGCHF